MTRRIYNQPLSVRFMAKVEKLQSGCWEWRAHCLPNGYGVIKINGKNQFAHRVSMQLAHGLELQPGQCVLHSCDNPPCVNPEHLFLGTQADNTRDMLSKGRGCDGVPRPSIWGEKHYHAKLTADDVLEMRRVYALGGITQVELGHWFGVLYTTAHKIVKRQSWAWLQDDRDAAATD